MITEIPTGHHSPNEYSDSAHQLVSMNFAAEVAIPAPPAAADSAAQQFLPCCQKHKGQGAQSHG